MFKSDKRDYLFRSFWDREDCYRILNAFLDKFKYGGIRESVRLRTNTVDAIPSDSTSTVTATAPAPVPAAVSASVAPSTDGKSQQRRASTADTDDVFDTGFRLLKH